MSQPASDTGLWSRLRAAGCVFRLPRRAATPAGSGTPPGRRDTAAYALFLLLACLPVWPAVFGGEVLLPAQYVRAFSPWRAEYAPPEPMPPWNALLADSILQYLPWRQFTHESLRAGYLPLWNPHQFCGTPFLANYQSAVFYPPNLLFWILPPARAFGYSALLHLFLAGAFLFLYLRGRGLGLAAATLGGVAFELSGFLMAWLELPTAVNVAVWLPLVLHLYERAREGSGARRGLPVLFPLAMILLAGHPQFAFYSLFAFACYSLAHLPNGTGPRERAAAWAWCAGLPLALAGLVAAPQILPMLELSRLSHRAGGSFLRPGAGAYLLQAQPAWAAIVLLLPDFFGNPSRGDAWGPANYAEFVGYTGVLPLLLAIAAVAGAALPRRRAQVLAALPPGAGRHIAFFAALAALAVATSFRNPLGQAFYSVMPGFGQFGSPGRMLFLFSVSVAVLGAFGTHLLCWSNGVREYWSGDAAGARPLPHNGAPHHSTTPPLQPPNTPPLQHSDARVLAGAAAVLALVGAGLWRAAGQGAADLGAGSALQILQATQTGALRFGGILLLGSGVLLLACRRRLSRGVSAGLLIALVAGDLLASGWGFNVAAPAEMAYPQAQVIAEIQARDPDARFLAVTPRWTILGYPDALMPPNAATYYGMNDVNGYDSLYISDYKAHLNGIAGKETSPQANGNMVLFDAFQGAGFPFLACRYVLSLNPIDLPGFDLVKDGPVKLYEVTQADARALVTSAPSLASKGSVPARVTAEGPTRTTVDLAGGRAGTLVLADTYYPGWTASVDGQPAPIERARTVFRGVRVGADSRRVTFRYTPTAFRMGLFLALMAVAGVAGAVTAGWVGTKKRRRSLDGSDAADDMR